MAPLQQDTTLCRLDTSPGQRDVTLDQLAETLGQKETMRGQEEKTLFHWKKRLLRVPARDAD
jgi:hypothetical protein